METPKETSINPEQSVIMPKETVIKTRIRLPTKRGWAAMKVADLFKAQKTLRELCRDHGAPLHLARHYLYQTKQNEPILKEKNRAQKLGNKAHDLLQR